MKKKIVLALFIGIILYGVTDGYSFYIGKPTIYSRVHRLVSGAPSVTIQGQDYIYGGTITATNLTVYKQDDNGLPLFKSADLPDQQVPPWVYVKKNDQTYFRYSEPKH